jgi:hypothetical protein
MFWNNKKRAERRRILTMMLGVLKSEKHLAYSRGLCSIITDCTHDDYPEFNIYFRKQRPTKIKHSQFYRSKQQYSAWWFSNDNGNQERIDFILYLIKKNRPFKLF